MSKICPQTNTMVLYADCKECEYRIPCRDWDIRKCPVCEKYVDRKKMQFTRDCHGISFRLVCCDCWKKLMEKGFDGEYYSEADECIDHDY